MSISVVPATGPLDAEVAVPGSKSIANRALVCAALADGLSTIVGVPDGDDTVAMLDCLGRLGVPVTVTDDSVGGSATLHVEGTGGRFETGAVALDAALAGTTSRFVTALGALADGPITVDGGDPLRRRPMRPLHDALTGLGASVDPLGTPGHLPVSVRRHRLHGGRVEMSGDVSSQFVTALMLVAPMLADGVDIHLTSTLVSRPYVAITAAVMASFGAAAVEVAERRVRVPSGGYRATDFTVEADASSASYPLAAAAIAGGRVRVLGLGTAALQGDAAFASVLGRMGCQVEVTDRWTEVRRSGTDLQGIDIDMGDMSDLVPTLAVVAAVAASPTRITGVGFIRHKESDRLGDLVAELRTLGVDAVEDADGLTVTPSPLRAGVVRTHHDHRLAMSLSLLGLVVPGVVIEEPEVVSKSWPAWWQTLETLRR